MSIVSAFAEITNPTFAADLPAFETDADEPSFADRLWVATLGAASTTMQRLDELAEELPGYYDSLGNDELERLAGEAEWYERLALARI